MTVGLAGHGLASGLAFDRESTLLQFKETRGRENARGVKCREKNSLKGQKRGISLAGRPPLARRLSRLPLMDCNKPVSL